MKSTAETVSGSHMQRLAGGGGVEGGIGGNTQQRGTPVRLLLLQTHRRRLRIQLRAPDVAAHVTVPAPQPITRPLGVANKEKNKKTHG